MRAGAMNLRDYAKGQPCTMRLPSVCNFDTLTTILAHLNMIGISGRGLKAPDILACFACANCHHVHTTLEFNGVHYDRDVIQLAFFEGMARTQYILIKRGILHW
jgi:hypothetical protein